jgi:hypothetical protein
VESPEQWAEEQPDYSSPWENRRQLNIDINIRGKPDFGLSSCCVPDRVPTSDNFFEEWAFHPRFPTPSGQ